MMHYAYHYVTNMSGEKNRIVVNDKMQKGYRYELSEPEGKNFAADFLPELTPKEMLALGVFGGKYMRDCTKEFPPHWFLRAKFAKGDKPEYGLNFFGVKASLPLSVWRAKGWIHADDPRGWFQWYCRYYRGRRHEDDARQIKRWKQMRRHVTQLRKNCGRGEISCRKKQRQSLLHWAYDSRKI